MVDPTGVQAPQHEPDDGEDEQPKASVKQQLDNALWEVEALRALIAHVLPDTDIDTELDGNVAQLRDGTLKYVGELGAVDDAPIAEDDEPDPEPEPQTVRERMQRTPPRRAPIAARPAGRPPKAPSLGELTGDALVAEHQRQMDAEMQSIRGRNSLSV